MMSTFGLGQMLVRRSGYGAMHFAGPYAFGPPPDRASAIGVVQAARTPCSPVQQPGEHGVRAVPPVCPAALSPVRVAMQSKATAKRAGTSTFAPVHGRSGSAVLRSRESP